MGALWAFIFLKNKFTSLLYFNTMGEKSICDRPAKQTFQCSVYKNGELISSAMSSDANAAPAPRGIK